MEYEKKYKEALKWVQKLYPSFEGWVKEDAEHYFPELKSDDEKIRKAIHIYLDWLDGRKDYAPKGDYTIRDMIAWLEKQGEQKQTWKPSAAQLIVIKSLIENKNTSNVDKTILRGMFDEIKQFTNNYKREIDDAYLQGICDAKHEIEKQGEQKPTDKVEPKFHEGDWIISNNKKSIYQVIEVKRGIYVIRDNVDNHEYHIGIEECEKSGRLWSINDAKDGDVLATSAGAFIYNSKNGGDSRPGCYCGINTLGKFQISSGNKWTNKEVYPATKEQRDLLFAQMHDAGYTWDSENKKLKKIEPKSLDPDKVIEWLERNAPIFWHSPCNPNIIVKLFKEDFEI